MLRLFSLSILFFLNVAGAFEVPALTGPVIDEVGILGGATKRDLEDDLYRLKQQSGIQLQVYVAKSLQGEEVESAAIKLFDQWKLGEEKTDKGLLFLIAPNEKRMRIEVGQGLEGDIPDVIAKRIISDVVRPYFQRGEYSMGILQGVSTLKQYLFQKDTDVKPPSEEKSGHNWLIWIVIGVWLLIFMMNPSLAIMMLFSGGRGGGGYGGGGGGWSGGGGRSSGGGASGGW